MTAEQRERNYSIAVVVLVALALGGMAAAVLGGCAPTRSYVAALKVEGAASEALLKSYQAWRVFDRDRQEQLLKQAPSMELYQAAVTLWRSDVQTKVDDAFIDAREAVHAYADALGAAGAERSKDFAGAIAKLLAAIADVTALMNKLGVPINIEVQNAPG